MWRMGWKKRNVGDPREETCRDARDGDDHDAGRGGCCWLVIAKLIPPVRGEDAHPRQYVDGSIISWAQNESGSLRPAFARLQRAGVASSLELCGHREVIHDMRSDFGCRVCDVLTRLVVGSCAVGQLKKVANLWPLVRGKSYSGTTPTPTPPVQPLLCHFSFAYDRHPVTPPPAAEARTSGRFYFLRRT